MPDTDGGNGSGSIETGIWDICSTPRGRSAIIALFDAGDGIDREELTNLVFEREADAGTVKKYESVRVGLYQTYLPRMQQAGLIEWDRDEDVVRATEFCTDLAEAISEVESRLRSR